MSNPATWQEQNREFLVLTLDELHARIGASGDADDPDGERRGAELRKQAGELREAMDHPPSLFRLAQEFALSDFERDLILLCLRADTGHHSSATDARPTVGSALATVTDSHWSAFDRGSPLRRWGIVHLDDSALLIDAELRLDADMRSYLLGFAAYPDADHPFELARRPQVVFPGQREVADTLLRAAAIAAKRAGRSPVIELSGASEDERRSLAVLCAETLAGTLATVDLRDLPAPGAELDQLLLRWTRHARLTDTQLLVHHPDTEEWPDDGRARRLMNGELPLLFVSTRRPATMAAPGPLVRHHTAGLTVEQREQVWARSLESCLRNLELDGRLVDEVRSLASQYRLSATAIEGVCTEAEAEAMAPPSSDDAPDAEGSERFAELLRQGCQRSVRARLDPVAERVPVIDVQDIELPEWERTQFEELKQQIRLTHQVDSQWGMGRGSEAAAVALFAGPSGTGKTHAALALARDLGLDLYRVNLATVLSKYIGETEKNLEQVFDAASLGGVILLFDEADALFGKRSEVRDSHDRYANLSTAYLLQQVERSLVPTILTTNMKEALDPAFSRRLHFVIEFPFPDQPARERIWESIFPARTPTGALEPERLGQLAVTGGTIRNVARRAAFLAAAHEHAVAMDDLREGAKREARKLERDLAPDELAGW